jgi:AsmA protein
MKPWMKTAAAIVGLVVVVVVAIPFLVGANTFRPVLESQLTAALGRQVKLGDLSLSILSGSLIANDLSIADDPAFSTSPFLAAKQLQIGVDISPLIFSRKLQVRSFEVDAPAIQLVRAANGTWNFSSLGKGGAGSTSNGQPSPFPNLTVGLISIKDGRAVVGSLPAQGEPRVYEHLNLAIQNFSFAKAFPFTVSASLPADGTVTLTGTAGPLNQQDAATTALDAQLSVKHLDPVAAGFVDAGVGVSMLADIDAHAASDGVTLTSNGTIHSQRLTVMKGGSPAPQPVDLTYNVTHTLKENSGQVQDLAVKTGDVAAHITGGYQLATSDPVLKLKLTGQSLPIDGLQALLPAAGVKLPNGSVLKGGTLSTTLDITGPAKDLVIAGPLELSNTRLAGFDLGSKMSGIATLGGVKTGDATSIQTLRMNLRVTNGGVQTDNLYALLPAVGEASGSGTVAPGGALDYRLTVKVTTASGVGKVGVGLLTALNGVVGGAVSGAAKNGVPVAITGTMSNPIIKADMKGLLEQNGSSILGQGKQLSGNSRAGKQNPLGALSGLLGKKK